MPTYEYACTECGQHIEVFQRLTDDPLTTCGACGGRMRKVFHPAGILFKGSGFYSTDSRTKPKEAAKEREGVASGSKASDSGGGDSTSSDSKTSDSKAAGSKASPDVSNTDSSSSGKPTEKSA